MHLNHCILHTITVNVIELWHLWYHRYSVHQVGLEWYVKLWVHLYKDSL